MGRHHMAQPTGFTPYALVDAWTAQRFLAGFQSHHDSIENVELHFGRLEAWETEYVQVMSAHIKSAGLRLKLYTCLVQFGFVDNVAILRPDIQLRSVPALPSSTRKVELRVDRRPVSFHVWERPNQWVATGGVRDTAILLTGGGLPVDELKLAGVKDITDYPQPWQQQGLRAVSMQ
ncbi:hypothetical protein D5S17_23775 [Pseudonocardiaceae bacterium YIM PH 21723]|nr:hypothetical protein D5S17_23775 [Pseudonocardiaceae bacterium YIM PH 21723]